MAAWLVVVVQRPTTRWVGFGWLLVGFTTYVVYRTRVVREPLRATVRAPAPIGAALALEYRRIVVPVFADAVSFEALDVACRLAAERGASVIALAAIEVPLDRPLDAVAADEEQDAGRLLDRARAIGELYGVRVTTRVERSRNAGRAIVEEASRRQAEIVVIGAGRRDQLSSGAPIFDRQIDFVLKHAPCRVMVASPPQAVSAALRVAAS
jgi:nucleotide-binding universal stress UspA family protein